MEEHKPTFMYHPDCPEGRIFDAADAEFFELEAEGWVDSPAKLVVEEPPRKKGKKEIVD